MRHIIAGAVLLMVALAVTLGVATVLQNMATSRSPQTDEYVPPSIATPGGKSKPGDPGRSFMMSRRMNDE
jgi:hypothetical protein